MRTVYEVWHLPAGTDVAAWGKQGDDHSTLEAARAAAGYPSEFDWESTADLKEGFRLASHAGAAGGEDWMIDAVRRPDTDADRIELAIEVISEYSRYDGAHHKTWVFDQTLRLLAGDRYEQVRPEGWSEGVAP